MGWVIIFAFKPLTKAIAMPGIWLLIAGGIIYTVGAIFYGIGKKLNTCIQYSISLYLQDQFYISSQYYFTYYKEH